MGHDHSSILSSPLWDILFISISCLAIGFYIFFVFISNKKLHLHRWPLYRTAFWIFGVLMALLVMVGPLATMAHFDFRFHMMGHLLLGMLAPLLLVLAAPMTLVLRALPVTTARKLTKVMRQRPISFITHPITASLLNIGGLWVLYTTPLFQWMHQHTWLYVLIHLHIILAGYVFTAAMIYIDPVPHRYSFLYRAIVFVFALGAHQILSKSLYAYPPEGVPTEQAEAGAKIMYYGGDAIDLVIIFLLCLHWYQASRPRTTLSESQTS